MQTTQLYIFKTDIGKLCANCEVHKFLSNYPKIEQWSLDNDDVDNVLRISTANLDAEGITKLINGLGHECREL